MKNEIGGYSINDIKVVLAFDIDKRKVDLPIGKAILEKPNCTPIYCCDLEDGPIVKMGKILDGVSDIMNNYPEDETFRIDYVTSISFKM